MTPQVTLDDAKDGLAKLLFLDSVPSAEANKWNFYVVSAVERLYRAFDYEMARVSASVTTNDSGVANLSDLSVGIMPAIHYVGTGGQEGEYNHLTYNDLQNYSQGDKQWAVLRNEDGEWELHTTEPNATLIVIYDDAPDLEGDADAKACFTKMVIAKGALIYYRQATDPEADTSVEEDSFRQEVAEIIDAQNRRRPQRFARTPRDQYGHYIGRT